MYEPHESFMVPTDPDAWIWRYIDLAKFLDLLERRQLHFARLDRLGDPFEGALSTPTLSVGIANLGKIDVPEPDDYWRMYVRMSYELIRMSTFVSCWHMNEHESEAMWKLYSGQGIAIRSTFRRLCECFGDVPEPRVYIGQVQYRDYARDAISPGNAFNAAMSKRKSFEHERELRAAIAAFPTPPDSGVSYNDLSSFDHPTSVRVPVSLETLIEQIYVSPGRPLWFRELVGDVLSRYGFGSLPIETSSLDARPDLI